MKIVVYINELWDEYGEEAYGLLESLLYLSSRESTHQFIFLGKEKSNTLKNVNFIKIKGPGKHPLLWKYWYDYKLPTLLKKLDADIFITGNGWCSMRSNIPQFVVFDRSQPENIPSWLKGSQLYFLKKYKKSFVQKATAVIIPGVQPAELDTDGKEIALLYPESALPDKANEEDQQKTRQNYSSGQVYFLYQGPLTQTRVVPLLKSFSLFKKRQKSSWALILMGSTTAETESLKKMLSTYRYREDVQFIPDPEQEQSKEIFSSAYAILQTDPEKIPLSILLSSFASGVPLVGVAGADISGFSPDLVMSAASGEPIDISEKMMLLYRDESGRKRLVEKASDSYLRYREATAGYDLLNEINRYLATTR